MEMATHSGVLSWRIPGMGEPGGLPSMGSHRVGHHWSDSAAAAVQGFPGGASGKDSACQCRRLKRRGFDSWVGKILWRRAWQPTLTFLPGESHGQRNFWAIVHGVTKTGIVLKCPSMHACKVQCILFLSNALIIVETYHPLVPFALYF